LGQSIVAERVGMSADAARMSATHECVRHIVITERL
jgi:hypothetical protein